jgi:aminoglycoside phosphotransferase (APT) family kinase protein
MSWDWSASELTALQRFLGERGLTEGPLTTRIIGDGHSNLTFLVSDGTRQVVVRRPPPPPFPPGANDMLREARLIGALAATPVPVAHMLAVGQVGEVLDVPFYVMSYVQGPVITTETPAPLGSPADRRRIGEALIDTLAKLHAVDWKAAGLADIGRPEGFNERHLRRIGRLVADAAGDPPPEFASVNAWLGANVPPEAGACIVHNDYRIGNVILEPEAPARGAAGGGGGLAPRGGPRMDVG